MLDIGSDFSHFGLTDAFEQLFGGIDDGHALVYTERGYHRGRRFSGTSIP